MIGVEQLLRRVVANSPSLHIAIVPCVVKRCEVPIDELHLVKFETRTNRVHHDITHFHVIVDNTCLMSLFQLLQNFVKN